MTNPNLDVEFLNKAIKLACEAEKQGNLPIGAVICLEGKIIGVGQNSIWAPAFNANRHAEIEAMRSVSSELWGQAASMVLYTTLEPCMMCLGAILLHHIGRVVFGAADPYGGAGISVGHLPPYFEMEMSKIEWVGPALPDLCDPLAAQVRKLEGGK